MRAAPEDGLWWEDLSRGSRNARPHGQKTPTPLVPSVKTKQPATPNANFDVERWTLTVPVYAASVIPDLVAAEGRAASLRLCVPALLSSLEFRQRLSCQLSACNCWTSRAAPTTTAVSARKICGPRAMVDQPAPARASRSSRVRPPSGPTSNVIQ